MSLAPRTAADYQARAARLHARYQASLALGDQGTPAEFATWLMTLKPTLVSASWRLYRTAATHALESAGEAEAAAMLRRDAVAPSTPATSRADIPVRGARMKAKRWIRADYDRVLTFLKHFSTSRRADIVVDWLRAGVSTGLRPGEWQHAELHGSDLTVQTAKSTNGRGNGGTRSLGLAGFAPEDFDAVECMCRRGAAWSERGIYEQEQAAAAEVLSSAVVRLWPTQAKHYSLYTGRHQAIASWKVTLSPTEVAARAGHSAARTAGSHYGKRRSGWTGADAPAVPDVDDGAVGTVRDNARRYPARARTQANPGVPGVLGRDCLGNREIGNANADVG